MKTSKRNRWLSFLLALIMLVGAVNMFGVDAAAGRAAETLVSNEATPAPAEAAILPAEPERLE